MDSKQRQFLVEFIELYKNLPELWKVKSAHYRDWVYKNLAYDALVKKYKEINPNADKAMVIKKVKILRTVYLRELKKVNTNKHYVPTLWYFKHLEFLKEKEMDENKAEEEEEDDDEEDEKAAELEEKVQLDRTPSVNEEIHSEEEIPAKKIKNTSKNYVFKNMNDYAQTLAKGWAFEFRQADSEQQIFAKKAIDDILFAARLGKLNTNSHQIQNMASLSYMPLISSPQYLSQTIQGPKKTYLIKNSQSNVTSSTQKKYFKSESPSCSISDDNTEYLDDIIEQQEMHPMIEVYMDEESTSMLVEDNGDNSVEILKKNPLIHKPHMKRRKIK